MKQPVLKRFCWLLILAVCASAVQAQDTLLAQIDTLLKYKLPEGSEASIAVYDLTARQPLYTYRDTKLSRPASTMKLLTAITALARPEADQPFRTEVWYRGVINRDTLQGDLYVVGGFDPEFDEDGLKALVDSVTAFPFHTVTGKVYGDVSGKDSLYWGSGWLWDDTPAAFQPYLSPLMLHKGTVTITVVPGKERGDSAVVTCQPFSTYYTIDNRAVTRTPDEGRLSVTRDWLDNGNTILVTGNVTGKSAQTINLFSSQDFFMHTFLERLYSRGISVQGGYAFAPLPADSLANCIGVWKCDMQTVLNELMKESDNLNAEALLWRLGSQATGKKHVSAADGLNEIKNLMRQLGHNPAKYRIADGCGLSHYDYLSPALMVDFLKFAYSRTDIFRKLYKSLPVAGIDGTLKFRMKKGKAYKNVHAKTGTYTGISALAGYLQTEGGHQLAFSIFNQNQLSASEARAFQDAVCEILSSIK